MIARVLRIVRTPLTLLVLLGVLCYGAWWGYTNVLKPIQAPPPDPCVNQTVPKGQLKTNQVTVSIFNGGTKKGLAGDVARELRDKGFQIRTVGNTSEKIKKTVVVGAGTKDPEVNLVKSFFKGSGARADKRPDHTVDVLVGDDYAGFNKKAKTTYSVKSKTVCLPRKASASAAVGG